MVLGVFQPVGTNWCSLKTKACLGWSPFVALGPGSFWLWWAFAWNTFCDLLPSVDFVKWSGLKWFQMLQTWLSDYSQYVFYVSSLANICFRAVEGNGHLVDLDIFWGLHHIHGFKMFLSACKVMNLIVNVPRLVPYNYIFRLLWAEYVFCRSRRESPCWPFFSKER